jgi:hypothetical protein
MTTPGKGICVYGYTIDEAQMIQSALETTLNEHIGCVSASGKEQMILDDILKDQNRQEYKEGCPHIVLSFGFDDTMIPSLLHSFPPTIARPIFCCLTPSNQTWPFNVLIHHLLEEQKEMNAQNQS